MAELTKVQSLDYNVKANNEIYKKKLFPWKPTQYLGKAEETIRFRKITHSTGKIYVL